MKKLMCSILSLMLMCTMAAPAFAVDADNPDNQVCFEVDLDNPDAYRKLTFDEVIEQTMEHNNISYEAARNQLLENEAQILARLHGTPAATATVPALSEHSIKVQYLGYDDTFSYSQNTRYKGSIVATLVVIQDYGVHTAIQDVINVGSRGIAGWKDYEWIEIGINSRIADDRRSVRIDVTGYFEVRVDYSLEGSVELTGFSIGGSVGSELTYTSETVFANTTFSAP